MNEEEHKKLLEHIIFLKKVVEDAPHDLECTTVEYTSDGIPHFVLKCVCWKSREMVTTPYTIPEKKKM